MPAPNQTTKVSSVTAQKRATRSSTNRIPSNIILTKGKSTVLAVKKGTLTSKSENAQDLLTKRKAEQSPFADKTLKRSAFGDITNAVDEKAIAGVKKIVKKPSVTTATNSKLICNKTTLTKPSTITSAVAKKQPVPLQKPNQQIEKTKENVIKKSVVAKKKTLSVISEVVAPVGTNRKLIPEPKQPKETTVLPPTKPVTRQSIRLSDVAGTSSSEDSSLYVSALEELNITDDKKESKGTPKPPPGVEDFDKENWNDPNQLSHYAYDIFNYLKSREGHYKIRDYMEGQPELTKYMRSLLVDWMVEVQESFELTHETLYLAVKIVDMYLSKVVINKNNLQLVGATSLFIASKFDERSPPVLEDIVYIGDQAYTDRNVIETEIRILKNLDFDLGFPLSYRFLRRYARCTKATMELLTLARFILEYCLMDYFVVTASDSKMGAAALHIARIMKHVGDWNATLEYYSGYKLNDFKSVAIEMNEILHKRPRSSLATVRNKYSHEVFFAVARTPMVENDKL